MKPQQLPPGQADALLAATQNYKPPCRIRVRLARQHVDACGAAQPPKPPLAWGVPGIGANAIAAGHPFGRQTPVSLMRAKREQLHAMGAQDQH